MALLLNYSSDPEQVECRIGLRRSGAAGTAYEALERMLHEFHESGVSTTLEHSSSLKNLRRNDLHSSANVERRTRLRMALQNVLRFDVNFMRSGMTFVVEYVVCSWQCSKDAPFRRIAFRITPEQNRVIVAIDAFE